jgi:hypothetical protein
MFYIEEDIMPAINQAKFLFGKPGTYLTSENCLPNIRIVTREYGIIWQGDVDKANLEPNLLTLSERLDKKIYLFLPPNNFDFGKAKVFYKN